MPESYLSWTNPHHTTSLSWSSQNNQPTAQFYRVNADNRFLYNVYGSQQDNTSVVIASRTTTDSVIIDKDWFPSASDESAFLAFNRDDPRYVMSGSYDGVKINATIFNSRLVYKFYRA